MLCVLCAIWSQVRNPKMGCFPHTSFQAESPLSRNSGVRMFTGSENPPTEGCVCSSAANPSPTDSARRWRNTGRNTATNPANTYHPGLRGHSIPGWMPHSMPTSATGRTRSARAGTPRPITAMCGYSPTNRSPISATGRRSTAVCAECARHTNPPNTDCSTDYASNMPFCSICRSDSQLLHMTKALLPF